MKTVFDEEIEVNDEIMYINNSAGINYICFGKVIEIQYIDKAERLKVNKTHEILYGKWDTLREVNKKVILTSPIAFKCNKMLSTPIIWPKNSKEKSTRKKKYDADVAGRIW